MMRPPSILFLANLSGCQARIPTPSMLSILLIITLNFSRPGFFALFDSVNSSRICRFSLRANSRSSKKLSFNTHNLFVAVFRTFSRCIENILVYSYLFLDYEKRRIRVCLISVFLPAHRICICREDGFGIRPPPFHYCAQARDRFFRGSLMLSSYTSIWREPFSRIK